MADPKAIKSTRLDIINAQWEFEEDCRDVPVLHIEDIDCRCLDSQQRLLLAIELNRATKDVRQRWAELLEARLNAELVSEVSP